MCGYLWIVVFLFARLALMQTESRADILNCPFEDTVNLTDSKKFNNGSYIYENIIVSPELVGVYDYVELFEGQRQSVPPHVRGCVCKLKRCVKFCCHPKEVKQENSWECAREFIDDLGYSPYVNVTLSNHTQVKMHVLDEFVVQQGIPCHDSYALVPEMYVEDEWELFENGTLLRKHDQKYLTKRDYCLNPHNETGEYTLSPANCPTFRKDPPTLTINTIGMFLSIPFLLATILVYSVIPQLRNLHGKCFICYLISLTIGFVFMVTVTWARFSIEICTFMGFSAYYFLMATFFWLSVICFDLWHNFPGRSGGVQHVAQRKRFIYYSIYAWGCPVVFTGITMACQFSDMDYALKPGIETYCWIKTDDWSAMIYFYGPNLLLILFNIVMFVLVAKQIYKIKKNIRRFSDCEENQKHLRTQQDNAGLFLRLFIVMGVTWVLEVAAYLVGSYSEYAKYFIVSDFSNAVQGIIIFVIFVLKPKVLKLIKKRIQHLKNRDVHNNSKRSTGGSMSMM